MLYGCVGKETESYKDTLKMLNKMSTLSTRAAKLAGQRGDHKLEQQLLHNSTVSKVVSLICLAKLTDGFFLSAITLLVRANRLGFFWRECAPFINWSFLQSISCQLCISEVISNKLVLGFFQFKQLCITKITSKTLF